ncbi:MAG TPA: KpsF/GutQ family sugar-phosphate isomerase [Opitutales bacterium]|nr:KpsF/GutQ family sugar-phosphate isomerase [Opitutales bacterium]
MLSDDSLVLASARQCFSLEIDALKATADALGASFPQVIHAIGDAVSSGRKLVFSGIGKNIPICQKIAATFNSTGVPSIFLDPVQAMHGDLGICMEGDLAFLFSNQGETEDVLRLIAPLRRMGLRLVAITGNPQSTLAKESDITLAYTATREACPLGLAPTSSTTAALALGDALAMVYLEVRGMTREEFAKYHPAGSIGKVLLLRVGAVLREGERFACLPDSVNVRDALLAITNARCGTIALTGPDGKLSGVFSDGDFRRASIRDEYVLQRPVRDFMTKNPRTVRADALAVEALRIFEKNKVNALIAVDADGAPVGLLDGQDLPKLRIV